MKRRYPGPKPFSFEDRDIFFGREREIEFLSTLIMNNKTTIIQGKSGYGKSSILSAGIIPSLLESNDCEIIRVRFYNYDRRRSLKPRDTLLKALQIQQISDQPYLHEILPETFCSAWRCFKQLQADSVHTVVSGKEEVLHFKTFILLFDQFEELFTYPKEQVQEFGKELFNIVQNRIPDEVQHAIIKEYSGTNHELHNNQDEFAILDKEIPVKLIFGIRSDRFNYLTYLSDYIPNFLNNSYKLRRMTESQVREAIIRPPQIEDEFDSPSFTYDENLLQKIIDFLSSDKEDVRKIEVFEMQIICSKLEEIAIQCAKDNNGLANLVLSEKLIQEKTNIRSSEKLLFRIIQNYYTENINALEDEEERLAARYLIEHKLIDPITKNRVSLDFVFIHQLGICQKTLSHLVDRKIIRAEINTVSGKSYELSHDSLIIPILEAGNEMGHLDRLLEQFTRETVKKSDDKDEKKQIQAAIFDLSVSEQPEDGLIKESDEKLYKKLSKNPLVTKINISASDEDKTNRLILKEAFRPAVQRLAQETQEYKRKGISKKFSRYVLGSVLMLTLLVWGLSYSIKRSNRYEGLVYVGYDLDSVRSKLDALALTNYLYKKRWNNNNALEKFSGKMLELLKTPEIQARLGVFNTIISTTRLSAENLKISFSGKSIVINNRDNGDTSNLTHTIFSTEGWDTTLRGAEYAYFLNRSDTLVLALTASSHGNAAAGDTVILFDCTNRKTAGIIPLGLNRFLYPKKHMSQRRNEEYDSYKIRQSNSGNLIIPLVEKSSGGTDTGKIAVWKPGAANKLTLISSALSTSTSRDGRMILAGVWKKPSPPQISVYDENGGRWDTLRKAYFADFTPRGSLVYSIEDKMGIRKYNPDGSRVGEDQQFIIKDDAEYVFVNKDETVALTQNKSTCNFINLSNGMVMASVPYTNLVAYNFDKNCFLEKADSKRGAQEIFDSIAKRDLNGKFIAGFKVDTGIASMAYSEQTDEVLLLTQDNNLILLGPNLNIRSRFALTANDLFGFSGNGKRFYYLLNDQLCVFENNKQLIDLFNFSQTYPWLENESNQRPIKDLKKRYKLNL